MDGAEAAVAGTRKALSRDATEDLRRALAHSDRRLLVAMERCASVVGPDFFQSAAQLLSVLLDVKFVFIAECTNAETGMAQTLAFWGEAGLADNLDFCTRGGPCQRVLEGEIVHVEEKACEKYPDNEALQALGPESYFGCPLLSSNGDVIGHIAAMDPRPMHPSEEDRAILRIHASRAAAELERRQIEDAKTADRIRVSEERFRLAQEAAEIGTWDMDVATGKGSWSDNYWEIYGLTPGSLLPGYETWIALIHPDDRERVGAEIKAALEGKAPYKSEFRIEWPDGTVRWLVGKGSVFRDEDGNPVRMIGVDYDVTEVKEAEQVMRRIHEELEQRVAARTQELSEANARLEREMEERGRMEAERQRLERQMVQAQNLETLGVLTGGVAHDFNNLLVAIMGNSELALNCVGEDSEARDYVRRSVEAAERASGLTQQLLSYSGKTLVTPEVLDLSALVSDMAELLNVTTGSKVTLRLDLAEEAVMVLADATQIRQIVMNVLTNAVEAMPDGGDVRIRTATLDDVPTTLGQLYRSGPIAPGSYACLAISDAGTGLDRATCAQIFDPFFTTKFLGRGLGLAAVLGIARTHHGLIGVDGDASGTTFTTLLPSVNGLPVTNDRPQNATAWQATGEVLIVDDEQNVCRTAAAMLRSLGFDTVETHSGPEAIECFERLHDELRFVFLDHAMPGMNGTETFLRLREIDPHVPVIVTSGYSETEIKLSGDQPRPAGFVKKPYRLARLGEELRAVLTTDAGPAH